jgi:F-type H+-transporting ATPase subunit alpha
VIETQAGDISSYIPTNVISITDGQIFLQSDLFYSGVRPALNIGISVSRVGGKAQSKAMRQVAGRLRIDLAQYRELEAFAQFGSDLDEATKRTLARGERMVAALNQPRHEPIPVEEQVAVLFAGTQGYLDELPVEKVSEFLGGLRAYMRAEHEKVLAAIRDQGELSDETEKELREAITAFLKGFAPVDDVGAGLAAEAEAVDRDQGKAQANEAKMEAQDGDVPAPPAVPADGTATPAATPADDEQK